MKAFTNESERAAFEAQMLYGVARVRPREGDPRPGDREGREAHRLREGDRRPNLEFLAAGGTAMALLDLGDVDDARTWIDRAAAVATEHPSPLRARRLETWRGIADAAAGDAAGDARAPGARRAAGDRVRARSPRGARRWRAWRSSRRGSARRMATRS